MKLELKQNKNFPPLAWIAVCCSQNVSVEHGKYVERGNDFFVEGAWSSDFKQGDFINAEWFCGSGGKQLNEKIVFSTPTHVVGGLFSATQNDCIYVSNSMYLIMSKLGYKLDNQYAGYEKWFNSICLGYNDYQEDVHVINADTPPPRTTITQHYFANLEFDASQTLNVIKKGATAPFSSFEDYENRLTRDITAMVLNSKDDARKHKFGVVSTISRGYDSLCCAVIAKKAGCDTALTFSPIGRYEEDCGIELAKQLGYTNIIDKDAASFKTIPDCVDAEFICAGSLGGAEFAVFDNEFAGNLMFSGDRGDSVWEKGARPCEHMFFPAGMPNHLDHVERRLWLGYVQVPMPLYGATSWKSIHAISNSDEMANWSVGGDYDRPIPRRIIEEAGIAREEFGAKKRGAGFTLRFNLLRGIKRKLSIDATKDFEKYLKTHQKHHLFSCLKYFWKVRSVYLNRLGIKVKRISNIELLRLDNPTTVRYLIPWAGERMINKYKQILENRN